MKGLLAVVALGSLALGSLALLANDASAAISQHRTSAQTHVRHAQGVFAHTYGYAPGQTAQNQTSRDRYQNFFESDSLGRQWFENPDRVPPPPHE